MSFCCFIGPGTMTEKQEEKIKPQLERTIIDLPIKNICGFMYSRGAGFELLAFEIILKLKETYPLIDIMLTSKIPFYEYDINHKYRLRISEIENNASACIDTARDSDILYARLFGMVEACDYCIVYYRNSYFCNLLINHAYENGKNIVLINEKPHLKYQSIIESFGDVKGG